MITLAVSGQSDSCAMRQSTLAPGEPPPERRLPEARYPEKYISGELAWSTALHASSLLSSLTLVRIESRFSILRERVMGAERERGPGYSRDVHLI